MARRTIYVFGSNEAGAHGGGTARVAKEFYGAVWGLGLGISGDSYAIPTKDMRIETLPLDIIARYVGIFRKDAEKHPELLFHVTKVGCGLAGYTEEDIAPLFHSMPENVGLPSEFLEILEDREEYLMRLASEDPAEAQRKGA